MPLQPRIDRGNGLGIEAAARRRQKQPATDAAGPDRPRRAGGNQLGQQFRVARQPDLARQDVGGAERQHGERPVAPGKPVGDLVERAVAAGCDDDLEIRLGLARQTLSVPAGGASAARDHRAAAPLQGRNHRVQPVPRPPPPPGGRIDDDQHAAA